MNKKSFTEVYKKTKRNIVIHNVHLLNNVFDFVKPYDTIFFDDCVHSQYKFIKDNIDTFKEFKINCVICLSTNLIRKETDSPIDNIKTSELHNKYHNNDLKSLLGFMTLNEIKDLLKYKNVFIALHGNDHIDLEKESKIKQITKFINDFNIANEKLKEYGIDTNIFVYPYDYVVTASEKFLRGKGMKFIYPSKNNNRIYIEELQNDPNIMQ